MNRHVIDVTLLRERASATPSGVAAEVRQRSAARTHRQSNAAGEDPSLTAARFGPHAERLRQVQLWFARAVMTPEAEEAAVTDDDASRMLTPGPHLRAIDRLQIYRRGYHARLIECLADDYPVLKHALGQGPFEELCRAYIARHPSTGANLNFFGRGMERFCRDEVPSPFRLRHFAADLASLEWAIVEVIHAPSSEALTLEGLLDVPIEAWATARLVPNSAFRLLRFESPVNGYFQSVREGRDPPLPSVDPSATVVYRSGPTVWRQDLTVPMFEVLSALVAGQTLAASLSRAEASFGPIDESDAAERVLRWFRDWVGSGLFVRVDLGIS